jgi:putative ABC transport system permease protein
MTTLLLDVRDAWRALTARPAFTFVLVLTLGLGIGAATTVYSFVYGILLRPYPYTEPQQLVRVQSVYTKEGHARRGMSLLDLEDYRRHATTLDALGAYTIADLRLLGDGPPQVAQTAYVNPDVLSLLGISPVRGRLLDAEDDRPGGDVNKAVIGHDVWQSLFGGDESVVGQPLRTDRETFTIVGVMPPGFAFPDRTGVWIPMEAWYSNLPAGDSRREKWRGARWYATVARLAPTTTVSRAQQELDAISAGIARDFAKDSDGVGIVIMPLREFEMGNLRPYLLVCLAGVIFVLLICCANVANLLLVRAAGREREQAVKTALGASQWRISRTLLLESLMLGVSGALVGVLVGWAGVRGLLAAIPVTLPGWLRIDVDAPVLAFSIAVGVATALLFGVGPALTARRRDVSTALREGARGSTRSAARATLVVGEIALSVMLLIGAGLLMQTFLRLHTRDSGFRSSGVVAARVVLWAPGSRQDAAAVLNNTHTRVLDVLKALPGVTSASVSNTLPYTRGGADRLQADIFVQGRSADEIKTLAPLTGADVSPDFFATMGIPLLRGRLFEPTDTTDSEPVVVISERAARMFFPNEDPIGHVISWGQPTPANPWTRIVGVVGNVRHHAAENERGIEVYYPVTQWPATASYYVLQTSSDPDALLQTIRRTINIAEPAAAVTSVKTMERTIGESLWQQRLWGLLFTSFALLALVLAGVGVYGVVSYVVSLRTREMGVRMALGATPAGVKRLVIRQGMSLCAVGAAIGIAGAAGVGQSATSLLYGVEPHDFTTYMAVVLTILAIGLIACWVPARRASRVDAVIALRAE